MVFCFASASYFTRRIFKYFRYAPKNGWIGKEKPEPV